MKVLALILCLWVIESGGPARAAENESTRHRSKTISFDEDVVEGINKNPMNYLQHVGGEGSATQSRLYKKKSDFNKELKKMVRELKHVP